MEDARSTLSATFHLTHACNLRCGYCYTGEKFNQGMSAEVADRGVDFAIAEARNSSAGHLEVVFFGGEPLLRMDLIRRICDRATERAAGLEVSFKTSTNGLLLDEPTLQDLAARQVYIAVSVDGDPETQDAQRPDAAGQGTSARLAPALDRLLAYNPCANVTCVCPPEGASRLDRSVRWLFERGFAYVTVAFAWNATWTAEDLDELRRSCERLAEWYIAQTLAGKKLYLNLFDERIRTWARGPLDKCERCAIGVAQFSIAPSGRLYPCIQFVQEDRDNGFAIGDVVRGFEETRRVALHEAAEAEKHECAGCALQPRCSSWCACVNYQTTGRVDRAGPLVCEIERILMPIADRAANRLWKQRDPTFLHKQYNPAFPVLSFMEQLTVKEAHRA